MDAAAEVKRLRRELEKVRDPAYAVGAKKYLKSDLEFIGARVPDVRRAAATWLKAKTNLDHDGVVAVTRALWRPPVFDLRLLATIVLQRKTVLLRPTDLPWLESVMRESKSWALLDNLVPTTVADILDRDGKLRSETLKRWSKDGDFWMRRSALLAMLRGLRRDGGDWNLWTSLAETMLEDQPRWLKAAPTAEERFFIRKAVGWVLRERAARQPADVAAFLRKNRTRMAGASLREAERGLKRATLS